MTDLKACRYVVARPCDGHEYGDYEVIDSESQTRIAQCARQRQADMIADALNTRADQGGEAVAWKCVSKHGIFAEFCDEEEVAEGHKLNGYTATPLYTHPPRATPDEARDAARYRWIREQAGKAPQDFAVVEDAAFVSCHGCEHNFDINIDEHMAIDAALAGKRGEAANG